MAERRYQGRYLDYYEKDGWEFVKRPNATGAVDLVALTDDKKLIFVEQHRVPFGGPVLELPAGLVGDEDAGEEMATAAARELEEETGYRATHLAQIAKGSTSPGMSTEEMTVFLATGLTRTSDGGGVDGENIIVHTIPLADAHDWLQQQARNGLHIALKCYQGIYFAQRHLDETAKG